MSEPCRASSRSFMRMHGVCERREVTGSGFRGEVSGFAVQGIGYKA